MSTHNTNSLHVVIFLSYSNPKRIHLSRVSKWQFENSSSFFFPQNSPFAHDNLPFVGQQFPVNPPQASWAEHFESIGDVGALAWCVTVVVVAADDAATDDDPSSVTTVLL